MERNPYQFIKVEDFFRNHQTWSKLGEVSEWDKDDNKKLIWLNFKNTDCCLVIQFVHHQCFRVRFNPQKRNQFDYSNENSRQVFYDTIDDLQNFVTANRFRIECEEYRSKIMVKTWSTTDNLLPHLFMVIDRKAFCVSIYGRNSDSTNLCLDRPIWKMAKPSIYFQETSSEGKSEYDIIQSVFSPSTAKYLGFGEQGGKSLCKHTCQLNYFNYDNMCYRQVYNKGPFEEREPLYHSDPSFICFNSIQNCKSKYGLFIDNPSQVLIDLTYTNSSEYKFGVRFGDLDYYVIIGYTVDEITKDIAKIIGTPRLKPRYALGYHQGCYGYENRGDLERVVKKYREYGIPLDGLHIDVDIQNNYQTFTIDENKFPNPREMFEELRKLGIKCSTNITPIISNQDSSYKVYQEGMEKKYFIEDIRTIGPDFSNHQDFSHGNLLNFKYDNYRPGEYYLGEVYYGDEDGKPLGTTGHYPDFAKKDVRVWWGQQFKYLFDMGLEMVWQDMTTPAIRNNRGDMKSFPFNLKIRNNYISKEKPNKPLEQTEAIRVWNLYSLNLHKATFHGVSNLETRRHLRTFIIGRGSLSGMHRYAGLWTGDNCSSWSFLQMNIAQVLGQGLCGIAICGQDIGGFEVGKEWEKWADPELLIRWTTTGAFLPWFRNHYNRKNNRKLFQEPWEYHERLGNTDHIYKCVLPVCKYYIELRYRLLQMFYDAMFENVTSGLPICRAMIINEIDDGSLYSDKISFLDNQFFVHKDMLVAPILHPNSDCGGKRDVYLPNKSYWYQFMNNRRPLLDKICGGTTLCFDAHIDDDPEHIPFIVPIFVRAGAIIPTIELEQYVGEKNSKNLPNPITFNIYPGYRGSYSTYLDDGISVKSAPENEYLKNKQDKENDKAEQSNNHYREVNISHEFRLRTRTINITRVVNNYTPKHENYYFVALLHDPKEVNENMSPITEINISHGNTIPVRIPDGGSIEADMLKNSETNAYYFNKEICITFIKIFDIHDSITIEAICNDNCQELYRWPQVFQMNSDEDNDIREYIFNENNFIGAPN